MNIQHSFASRKEIGKQYGDRFKKTSVLNSVITIQFYLNSTLTVEIVRRQLYKNVYIPDLHFKCINVSLMSNVWLAR